MQLYAHELHSNDSLEHISRMRRSVSGWSRCKMQQHTGLAMLGSCLLEMLCSHRNPESYNQLSHRCSK
jgi:hypothetical protein